VMYFALKPLLARSGAAQYAEYDRRSCEGQHQANRNETIS
jgi:hypothetical protein